MKNPILNSDQFESIPFEEVECTYQCINASSDIEVIEVMEEPYSACRETLTNLITSFTKLALSYGIYFLQKKTDNLRDELHRQRHFREIRQEMQSERSSEYWRKKGTVKNPTLRPKPKVTVIIKIKD